jgi:tetratricopeptide (TPR) repeat protein
VLAHLVAAGRADDAAGILLSGRRVYSVLGLANEALAALVGVLDSGALTPELIPRVLVGAGGCAYVCHDPRTRQFLSAVDDLNEVDLAYRVFGHTTMCAYLADTGDADGALRHATAGLEAAEASGDPRRQTIALSAAGWAALHREAYEDSVTYGRAQLELATNDETTALALTDLALAELFLESTDAALETAGEALRLAWRQGQSTPVGQAQQLLGFALVQADDAAGAAPLLVTCLRTFSGHHDVGFTIDTSSAVGLVACMLGMREEGARLIRECNAVTAALFGGVLAVMEPLRGTAARYGVDISHEEDRVLPPPNLPELFEQALTLGERVISQSVDPLPDSDHRPASDTAGPTIGAAAVAH